MTLPTLKTERFIPENGVRVLVQVPEQNVLTVIDYVLNETNLQYGDYDSVTFRSKEGIQQFRSLGTGRNVATKNVVEVPCTELSFFLQNDDAIVNKVIEAIYAAHPYEEPVIFIEACMRTRHIRGLDEDNSNRFWNSAPMNWVPKEHQS